MRIQYSRIGIQVDKISDALISLVCEKVNSSDTLANNPRIEQIHKTELHLETGPLLWIEVTRC